MVGADDGRGRSPDQEAPGPRRALPAQDVVGRDVSVWAFTEVVTRLRRVLRTSIRRDIPWETLPMAQVELLQGLAERPGQRLREVAERHRLANNTVSTLVEQMVSAGLIERHPDPHDRRAVTVMVTDHGKRALAQWMDGHERRFQSALDGLSAADRRRIIAAVPALARLVHQLELAEPSDPAAEPAGAAGTGHG
ncbi:MarR family winged helix-turn-helix transcriptional regulator [Flexivirga caeni]|uniref:MarR family transcriptional regulator n=1 Tax=Flexivirga caeni TaxID=2294115 RepID=A0A3M9MH12_9MICO|nr:MarR family winged helix-turn-helix transcriptional regulator [Flexivirga caeni]RNI24821.1 MarR family transcriptional regulator [Flexivirga caeni]